MTAHAVETYVKNLHLIELTGKQEAQLAKALRQLNEFVSASSCATWRAAFQKGDPEQTGRVAYAVFAAVLQDNVGTGDFGARDVEVIKNKLYPHETQVVNYTNFYNIFGQYMMQKNKGTYLAYQ